MKFFTKLVCVAAVLATLACAVGADAATVVRRRGLFGRQVTVVRNVPVRAQAIVVPGSQSFLAPHGQAIIVPQVPQAVVVPNQNFLVPQQQLILVR